MKIITVPHQTLRRVAEPVTAVTDQLLKLSRDLPQTLKNQKNPPGVGLAAPQVGKSLRLFATFLSPDDTEQKPPELQLYINPFITKTSPHLTFGPDPNEPFLEGCLSIPHLYGPVPRWEWIEVEYQFIQREKLVSTSVRVADFRARVFQHELDHLNGQLFTDYVLKYELPLYKGSSRTSRLTEVDPQVVLGF